MKNFIKRLVPFALAAVMLCILAVSASAANEYVKWELSEDISTLTGEGKVYTRYEEPFAFEEKAKTEYRYANEVSCFGKNFSVYAPYKGADLVYLYNYDYGYVIYCATEEAMASVDRFFNGEGEYYLETDYGYFSKLDVSLKDAIFEDKGDAQTRTEDVYGLKNTEQYDIVVFDESDTFYYAIGKLFKLDGSYWFADYSELPNNCFTADGDLSFRSGEITLRAVDVSLTDKIDSEASVAMYRSIKTTWEDYQPYYEQDTSEMPESVFWIVYSIIGFAIPAIIGGTAAVVANLKKLKKPKYFYSVSICCAVWIICAVIIAIMVA